MTIIEAYKDGHMTTDIFKKLLKDFLDKNIENGNIDKFFSVEYIPDLQVGDIIEVRHIDGIKLYLTVISITESHGVVCCCGDSCDLYKISDFDTYGFKILSIMRFVEEVGVLSNIYKWNGKIKGE